ncbi:putative transmembrane protein [Gregarina niphandrodes]|uniref:Transmembrane protein n=1 Tax=Gregarina niphandrodes TaxID=110365 RepID=A0A023B1D4_GRENI|nr:putative transmembrane protein [Gregarina niphandrodes]EZG46754.1 putative transmembrane protein [Gregarina niphandrodes]|eukprot:XP_011132263.1 putative transmembrane protein [Gregarina niphandrodes]
MYFLNLETASQRRVSFLHQLQNATRVEPLQNWDSSNAWYHDLRAEQCTIKGELSLTLSHLSILNDNSEHSMFVFEDDSEVTMQRLDSPVLYGQSLADLGSLLEHVTDAYSQDSTAGTSEVGGKLSWTWPLHCQRTVLGYWLWPASTYEINQLAMLMNSLYLTEPVILKTNQRLLPFNEAIRPFVHYLPIYSTSFGAAGSVCLWYSKAAATETLRRTKVQLKTTGLFPGKTCAIDLVLNSLNSYTLWPSPTTTILPGTIADDGEYDIRNQLRSGANTHDNVHKLSYASNLKAVIEAYRFTQNKVRKQLQLQPELQLLSERLRNEGPGRTIHAFNAFQDQSNFICTSYLKALVEEAAAQPMFNYVWIFSALMLWALTEAILKLLPRRKRRKIS